MLLLALTWATQVSWHTEQCPLDGGAVRVFEKVSANTHGGWDSDLAAYSSQGQWREYALATCSDNLYTVYGSDIALTLTPEQAASARTRLAEIRSSIPDPDSLEVWDRYLIAAEMYRIRGTGPKELFELYLEASWTARDAAVGVYLDLAGPEAARDLLDRGRTELEGDLDNSTRKVLLHNLARIAHRGGWPVERDHYLERFEAVGELTVPEREVLERFRHAAGVVEPRLQDLALEQAEAWLASAESEEDAEARARVRYLYADLLRRRGRLDEARASFEAVQKDPALTAQLAGLARFLEGTIPKYR